MVACSPARTEGHAHVLRLPAVIAARDLGVACMCGQAVTGLCTIILHTEVIADRPARFRAPVLYIAEPEVQPPTCMGMPCMSDIWTYNNTSSGNTDIGALTHCIARRQAAAWYVVKGMAKGAGSPGSVGAGTRIPHTRILCKAKCACAARTEHAADLVAVQLLHLHARVGRVAAGEFALHRPSSARISATMVSAGPTAEKHDLHLKDSPGHLQIPALAPGCTEQRNSQ